MILAPNFHIEVTSIVTEFITLLRLYDFVDMMQSMNGTFDDTISYVWRILCQRN